MISVSQREQEELAKADTYFHRSRKCQEPGFSLYMSVTREVTILLLLYCCSSREKAERVWWMSGGSELMGDLEDDYSGS